MSLKYKLVPIIGNGVVPGFSIGAYPVTNADYREFLTSPGAETKLQIPKYWNDPRYNHPNQPVVGISWHDAEAFCKWAGLELPTSAEWGLAAGPYPENPLDYGWFHKNSDGRLHQVGEKRPNSLGLYDMWGNVWEWISTAVGSYRGLRGGSWFSSATYLRSADRLNLDPTSRYYYFGGFRCSSHQPRIPESCVPGLLSSKLSTRWVSIFEE